MNSQKKRGERKKRGRDLPPHFLQRFFPLLFGNSKTLEPHNHEIFFFLFLFSFFLAKVETKKKKKVFSEMILPQVHLRNVFGYQSSVYIKELSWSSPSLVFPQATSSYQRLSFRRGADCMLSSCLFLNNHPLPYSL